jgi:dUTP pyrophosphatase
MQVQFTGNQPKYMSEGAAGADLAAQWGCEIEVGQSVMIDTGTSVAIPHGFVGLLVPRSSLCNKGGLTLINSVGVLDSDYRGSIKFVYKNNGKKVVIIKTGERIGQLVITPVVRAEFHGVGKLDDTVRGSGGFGSTGEV